MHPDRAKWNRRHRRGESGDRPSAAVVNHIHLARPGRALDIAAGSGRNALFMAARGFAVDAVDISDVGLRMFAGRHPNVFAFCADLETYEITPNRYSLIVNINYLNRRLFPAIREGLVPGGLLIFKTYLTHPGYRPRKSFRPDHLLATGELAASFPGLTALVCAETDAPSPGDPYPHALLVAVKGEGGWPAKKKIQRSSTAPSPEDSHCGRTHT